jgi:molecular chaperone DnaK
MTSQPLYVGIDLGTTNSAAAVFDGDQVHLVRTAQGGTLTPSVVRIDKNGVVTVGARARRFLETDPQNTRSEFKRLMGTRQDLGFAAAKSTRKPEELAAEVLKSLRADIQEQFGFAPARAVVCVPALFELPQSSATSEAARLAGFERIELIQEPVASALAAGWKADDDGGGAWLVYDLGGGTFDASLLETRDGLLRVVGHDGDNFLGGRDFDNVVVDWALQQVSEANGVTIQRADPQHAVGVRRLKLAAEEAKIDLSRTRETALAIPGAFTVDGNPVDVDVVLDRTTLEKLVTPLIDRSIGVCLRLLATHGLAPDQVRRVVLVGGPTVMPLLRERVGMALGARFSEGLDPMTLVAQGAAIYAATAGLDARPAAPKAAVAKRRFWLQYPAMSSDLWPHVAGRLLEAGEGPIPAEVRFTREGWESPWSRLGKEGGLVVALELLPRRPNVFRLEARTADGQPVVVDPQEITIVQGMTITDPPLSRTVGVALASDRVHTYLERGTPLPAKRTFLHQTVESVAKGVAETALRIPIVQGEFEQAHLCRLVGTLEIDGRQLTQSLPAGTPVEVTIELDRGGQLQARALVPSTGQVFEQVAQLVVPDAAPETLEKQLDALRTRLQEQRARAMRRGDNKLQDRLYDVEWMLSDAYSDISAARGGDADSAQKARRTLLEIDAKLEDFEVEGQWPELESQAKNAVAYASHWVSTHGSPEEQRLLGEVMRSVEQARQAKQVVELQRQIRLVKELGTASYFRHPDAWSWEFESAAADVSRSSDLGKAQDLVKDGRAAQARGDTGTLRNVTQALWKLLPHDPIARRLGHDSGLR